MLVQVLQRCVPSLQVLVAQVLRVCQAPLPSAVLVAPLVAVPVGSGNVMLMMNRRYSIPSA